jgi:hypothetical protein
MRLIYKCKLKKRLVTTLGAIGSLGVKGSVTNLSLKEDSDTSNILKFYIVPVGKWSEICLQCECTSKLSRC